MSKLPEHMIKIRDEYCNNRQKKISLVHGHEDFEPCGTWRDNFNLGFNFCYEVMAEEYINADKCFAAVANDALVENKKLQKQLAEKDLLLSECLKFSWLPKTYESCSDGLQLRKEILEKLKGKGKQ